MGSLSITVLGAGDTFSEVHTTASLLVRAGDFQLAIDCPDRYRGVLKRAGELSSRPLSIADIDHVLITHVHGDHMNGLEGFAFFKHFAEGKRTRLLTVPEVRADLWERRLAAPMESLFDGEGFRRMRAEDYFEDIPLSWTREVVVGPMTIRVRRTIHHVPTSAVLVSAYGRTLGYSADTAFDPGLLEFLAGADVVIHETNFGPAHTPYEKLASLPEADRARMRLIHYPDSFDRAASVIRPLTEGDVLDL